MKCFIDRLRDCSKEQLKKMIKSQINSIKIAQRDLEYMYQVLSEKSD
jgi:hypothetical protein